MRRAMIGAGVGAACGVLVLAMAGAWAGYTTGVGGRLPPGWDAALTEAFVYTAYFWWLTATVGGVIGGLAGLGSWFVRKGGAALRSQRPNWSPRVVFCLPHLFEERLYVVMIGRQFRHSRPEVVLGQVAVPGE
jgi:hypothetical protein